MMAASRRFMFHTFTVQSILDVATSGSLAWNRSDVTGPGGYKCYHTHQPHTVHTGYTSGSHKARASLRALAQQRATASLEQPP
jgi:hypothetical protein